MKRAGSVALVVLLAAGVWAVRGADTDPAAGGTEGFVWQLPRGFPVPLVPAHNPMSEAKVALGRLLFYDTRLSANDTTSCASCHRPELAFTDGRAQAVGATGERHARGAMSLANVAYNASLTWADASLRTLERQMHGPMFNDAPVEMGIAGNERRILERLREDPDYPELFGRAFPAASGPRVTMQHVVFAIASFERTLISGDSPYDRWVYHGDDSGIDDATRRGMRLFFSPRLHCADCHGGFTFGGPVAFEHSGEVEPVFHNTGLYNVGGTGDYPPADAGLYETTCDPADMGRFRAPTLRNIVVTAPYMHDGSIETLDAVIDFYAAGGRALTDGPYAGDGRDNPHKSERVAGFTLTDTERRDLLRFLASLTDRQFLTDASHGAPARGDRVAVVDPVDGD